MLRIAGRLANNGLKTVLDRSTNNLPPMLRRTSTTITEKEQDEFWGKMFTTVTLGSFCIGIPLSIYGYTQRSIYSRHPIDLVGSFAGVCIGSFIMGTFWPISVPILTLVVGYGTIDGARDVFRIWRQKQQDKDWNAKNCNGENLDG